MYTLTANGTYSLSPGPGFYYIRVTFDGYFDDQTENFRFDGTQNLLIDLEMEKMPPATSDLTVHVDDSTGGPLPNATVEVAFLRPSGAVQVIASDLTNETGNASFAVWDDTFEVRVQKEGFNKSVNESVLVSGSLLYTATLFPGIKLVGVARTSDGSFVQQGLVAFLYNNDTPTPKAKRLMAASVAGSSYTFFAYPGNFTLIVDADGKAANVTQLLVFESMTPAERVINRNLTDSPEERVAFTAHYIQDSWNSVTIWRNLTLNQDSVISGLPFVQVRNLRLQIDLALGNGDGVLNGAEITAFQDWLLEGGPKHVDTAGLFTTNSLYYRSNLVNGLTDHNVTLDVPQSGVATIVSWANYTLVGGTIASGLDRYYINVTAGHDPVNSVRVNHTYQVNVVQGYERVTINLTGNVAVTGYTTVIIDPGLGSGNFTARVEVEPSLNGSARPQVVGPPGRFTELNTSAENYTAIVPLLTNVNLSAELSPDPNFSPPDHANPDSNFTWVFTNESAPTIIVYGMNTVANFTSSGNYTGNLTIKEVGGNVTYGNLTVIVDGIPPVARIENNITGLGTNANGTEIRIDEDQRVRFFGGNSTDLVLAGFQGRIGDYRWDFDGDGLVDASGERVDDWTFSDPGNFTVNLTVLDQAGHESVNATLWVVVADITPPSADFQILDTEFNEALDVVEGNSYYFDASQSSDNFDVLENLTFEWSFGDGTTLTGVNVTKVYQDYGTYNVVLNVTDMAGNTGNATRQVLVEVDPPTRPDLEVDQVSLFVDPSSPEESTLFGTVLVTIRFNVTNLEDRAAAQNVTVVFRAFRSDQQPGDPILITPTFDGVAGANTLDPGQTKMVQFVWAAPEAGNYTLRINVSDAREPELFIGPRNTLQTQIDVRQAGWKTPLTIAAIVGVIGGIPTAIYVRRRLLASKKERITK